MMGDASWKGVTLMNDMSGRVSKGIKLSKILRWLRGGMAVMPKRRGGERLMHSAVLDFV
ncbi:hypothetical protein [Bartonella queenslandensis]|uniref:hypothetical protein n=1 Tax=Bartonella queenslandensis TaxID=481138 RepID=UPI00030B5512|nr:hypothetical protein [Bartonella queenslandensis]